MVALRRARVRSHLMAWVLVVLTALGSSGAWHVDSNDPDFAASLPHDHSRHDAQLDHRTTPDAPTHCAICHWLQTFRSGDAAGLRVLLQADNATAALRPVAVVLHSATRIDVPSRAPPVLVA